MRSEVLEKVKETESCVQSFFQEQDAQIDAFIQNFDVFLTYKQEVTQNPITESYTFRKLFDYNNKSMT